MSLDLNTALDSEQAERSESSLQPAAAGPRPAPVAAPPSSCSIFSDGWTWTTDPAEARPELAVAPALGSRRRGWLINAFAWSTVLGGR